MVSFLIDGGIMPKKKTQEEFATEFDEKYGNNYELLSEYVNSATHVKIKHIVCGYEFDIRPYDLAKLWSCPCCSNKVVVPGINDLWSTHPDIAKCLNNPMDGYSVCYGSHKKIEYKCPLCGKVDFRRTLDAFDKNGSLICSGCGDGFSYPEKYMIN